VGELGFGTGLNFLALWDALRRHGAPGARLHFISVEGFPLTRCDAQRALSAFADLADLAADLIDAWPSPHKGAHRRAFDGGRVSLTVFHDEAEAALAQMDFAADAWFLDGFAPAKNPDMWTPALFDHIARLSRPGAPAATFTVAGAVRRGLAGAGFQVEKKPGFARKRERLEAVYQGPSRQPDPTPTPGIEPIDGPVAVIGGGIAAASLTHALTRRGRDVTVFTRGGWAAGASSAPLGLLTPRLEAGDRPHARALMNAFDYAAWLYRRLGVFTQTGVLRCAPDAAGEARLQTLAELLDERFEWLDAKAASARTGAECAPGLWMEAAGVFEPARVVAALAGSVRADDVEIGGVERGRSGWRLTGVDGSDQGAFAAVINAGGDAAGPLTGLDLESTAGRVVVFDSDSRLQAPAAWGAYAAPFGPGRVLVGATHVKGADPGDQRSAEAQLRAAVQSGPLAGGLALGPAFSGWGGVRAATPDRLPVAGLLPDESYRERWRTLARGGSDRPVDPGVRRGFIALGALGARGFAHAPLLAEHIAARLCGEPPALESGGLESLHPARFAWRALKRGG
jgi:tRNA 5-methylaminomethyl-2-thiouridine biosynthesis bifunctional protein